MFRVGDRVSPFDNMSKVGTVVKVFMKKSDAWFVGGTSGDITMLTVDHDDGHTRLYQSADLRKIDI